MQPTYSLNVMLEHPLGNGASPESIARLRAAIDLASRCPLNLGREVALTGSASRGASDEDSDIEFVAWADEVATSDQRRAWLRSIGAEDFAPEPHVSADGTVWEWSRYQGFWLETGFQSIGRHEKVLQNLIAGQVTDHRVITVADAVLYAVPLRTEGLLARWQRRLQPYPPVVQRALIKAGARRWQYALSYWALARRGDRVATAERLLADVQSILRIVFALNRTWEPAWKWSAPRSEALATRPTRLTQRIDEILSLVDLERSCEACAELFADVLALVPQDVDVTFALDTIRASLRERRP